MRTDKRNHQTIYIQENGNLDKEVSFSILNGAYNNGRRFLCLQVS